MESLISAVAEPRYRDQEFLIYCMKEEKEREKTYGKAPWRARRSLGASWPIGSLRL
jgi:hypothetical protein